MPNIIKLDVTNNNISSLKVFYRSEEEGNSEELFWNSLQILDLSNNKINELGPMSLDKLLLLDLCSNEIKKTDGFTGLPSIKKLKLKNNQINDTSNLSNMPELTSLSLGNNRIKNITGLETLQKLKKINLRNNNIFMFDEEIPDFESLEKLNLRSNKIEKIEEIGKLASLSKLKDINVSFNPFIEKNKDTYIFEILTKLPNLKTINKHAVTFDMLKQKLEYNRKNYEKEQRELEEKLKEEENN